MEYSFIVRKLQDKDKPWIIDFITQNWGSPKILSRWKEYSVESLDGFVAVEGNNYLGLITVNIEDTECQIVTLDTVIENIGIGTRLLNEAIEYAKQNKCKRIWLVTTNDNTPALRFYQTRAFKLRALYCNEIEYSRKLKLELPLYGIDSIPIRDEIELEYKLE